MSRIIKFEDIKDRLNQALHKRDEQKLLHINEPVTLVNGFIKSPLSKEISASVVLGGPEIPMVALLGKQSGRLYFFALKALISDLEESEQ